MKHILKCPNCGKYSMKETCECGTLTISPIPPKYSPEDKYGGYRRQVKSDNLTQKGLL